jgi:hypothetical protein
MHINGIEERPVEIMHVGLLQLTLSSHFLPFVTHEEAVAGHNGSLAG